GRSEEIGRTGRSQRIGAMTDLLLTSGLTADSGRARRTHRQMLLTRFSSELRCQQRSSIHHSRSRLASLGIEAIYVRINIRMFGEQKAFDCHTAERITEKRIWRCQ